MSSYTPHLKLAVTPEQTNKTFKEFRMELAGDTNSNMTKIDNAFERMDSDLSALKVAQSKVYGVQFSGSSPTGTRLNDAVGMSAAVGVDDTPASNDFDAVYPWAGMRRCNGYYDDNGDFVVTAYKGDPNYSTTGANGNVWVEIPSFYVKEVITPGTETEELYISPFELDGFRLPEKFKKINGDKRGRAYIAAYESGKVNNVPVSVSGVDSSSPAWSHNNYLTACANIGPGYCAMTMEDVEVLQFLFLVEFATRDSQSIMQGAVVQAYTPVAIAEATTAQNYVLIPKSNTTFGAGYAIKLHTTDNSAAGDYHIIDQVVNYYVPATSTYDSTKSYFTRTGSAEPYTYTAYTYNASTWASDWEDLWVGTDMKKVILEENASVTVTTATKIYNCPFKTGYCDNVVASSGAYRANDGHYPIVYRGIENPWGNINKVLSGILFNEYQPYYLKDASHDPVNNSASSIAASMTALSYTIPTSGGWAKTMGYDSTAPGYRLTSATGGSSSTYYCDYFHVASGVRCVRFGSSVGHTAGSPGLFYFNADNTPSNTYWDISSRLSYTG